MVGCDLYLYDATRPVGERLTQVSAGEELGAGIHEAGKEADVFNGVTAISGDGSHVYFVAEGVLSDEESPSGEKAQAGEPNLYLWDAGSEATSFLGTLDKGDAIGGNSRGFGLWGRQGSWQNNAYPVPATAKDAGGEEVGGDGHLLVFESRAELSSADADGAHLDVYRYDAGAEPASLQCLSCRPGGPDSAPVDVGNHGGGGEVIGTDFAEEGRWVSEDGETAGFLTSEGLVAGDVNGTPDFYLWRKGSLVRLPGKPFVTGANNGPFLSHDASTIAFATQSQLSPQDGDTTADVYVVRVDGGYPNPPAPTPCEPGNPDPEKECQQAQAPPASPKAESEAPRAGNPAKPAPCRKGKVRRGKRCVAKHPHKQKRHAKHKHRKGDAKANRRAAK